MFMPPDEQEQFNQILTNAIEDLVNARPSNPAKYLAKCMQRYLPVDAIEEESGSDDEDSIQVKQSESHLLRDISEREEEQSLELDASQSREKNFYEAENYEGTVANGHMVENMDRASNLQYAKEYVRKVVRQVLLLHFKDTERTSAMTLSPLASVNQPAESRCFLAVHNQDSGQSKDLIVDANATMRDLRIQACEEFGIKEIYYNLVANGKEVPGLYPIKELHINEKAALVLVKIEMTEENWAIMAELDAKYNGPADAPIQPQEPQEQVQQEEKQEENRDGPFSVYVVFRGKAIKLETNRDQRISELKDTYRGLINSPGQNIDLKFQGQVLNDDSAVGESSLENNSRINATLS